VLFLIGVGQISGPWLLLYPLILLFCLIGAYSLQNNRGLVLMLTFSVVGYLMGNSSTMEPP
jgi:TctA family transporter